MFVCFNCDVTLFTSALLVSQTNHSQNPSLSLPPPLTHFLPVLSILMSEHVLLLDSSTSRVFPASMLLCPFFSAALLFCFASSCRRVRSRLPALASILFPPCERDMMEAQPYFSRRCLSFPSAPPISQCRPSPHPRRARPGDLPGHP